MLHITPKYAAILALLFVALSVRTLRLRRKLKIGIGHGENDVMQRAIRAHANFAEYAPLTLLLIMMLEANQLGAWLVHCLCICLLAGRVIHAYGVSQVSEVYNYRVAGMALTFTALGSAALTTLFARGVYIAP